MSYSFIIAFIPLIASLSLFASKIYELNISRINFFLNQKDVNELIIRFLPYSTGELNAWILKLVENATTVGRIGSIGLVISAFLLYGTAEKTLSIPWGRRKGRPLHKQLAVSLIVIMLLLISFTLHATAGRLLIMLHLPFHTIFGKLISFAMLITTFTIGYQLIPAAKVKLSASIRGGLFAAILYQIFKLLLSLYITNFFVHNKVWGSLILIPIAILSLYILSLIIVLGNEMTFVVQNYGAISENIKREHRRQKPF